MVGLIAFARNHDDAELYALLDKAWRQPLNFPEFAEEELRDQDG